VGQNVIFNFYFFQLISAAETQIPLYLSEVLPDMSQANDVDSFLIFISRKDVDSVQQPQLCLELPYYPETLSDLLYIRFWLFQLSQCYFDSINFSCAVFNPSIVQLLFCHFTEGADLLGPGFLFLIFTNFILRFSTMFFLFGIFFQFSRRNGQRSIGSFVLELGMAFPGKFLNNRDIRLCLSF